MESNASIADITSVSFADFETKNREDNASFENFADCQAKHDMGMTLDLSLGQKAENLFDQTPTPTRLIKNCDEVGLFEDLQHVNPFDIGFQRAAEQNAVAGQTLPVTPTRSEAPPTDGDSLHTPQVYPVDAAVALQAAVSHNSSPLDVPVPNVEDLLATPTPPSAPVIAPVSLQDSGPPPLQLIQPQVYTLVLPVQTYTQLNTAAASESRPLRHTTPTQKIRPLILPKPSVASNTKSSSAGIVASTTPIHEPSSASLTPTSQLPIKERLKAILNHSKRPRNFASTAPKLTPSVSRNEDCMVRHRAAASRYRHKMRREHKEIKEHNVQLQQEVRMLRERVATLERQLQQQTQSFAGVVANQIQIPPSSIHLVINVPKMMVPPSENSQRLDKR